MEQKIKNIWFIIRVFLLQNLTKLIIKIGVYHDPFTLNNSLKIPSFFTLSIGLCYYETIILKINDFDYGYKGLPWEDLIQKELARNSDDWSYDWNSLRNSILEEGIKHNIKVSTRYLHQVDGPIFKYELEDGNHRLKVLESLYGGEHEIKVDIYAPLDYLNMLYLIKKNREKLKIKTVQNLIDKTY